MDATSAVDMPEPEALAGQKFDTSAAFGGGAGLAKDTSSQMEESGLPGGSDAGAEGSSSSADSSGSGPDETLQQILKGEVPKSGPAS